jgi:hypothetical protein
LTIVGRDDRAHAIGSRRGPSQRPIETMTAERYVQTEPLKKAGRGHDSLTLV